MALTIWFVLVGAVYGLVQRYVGYMIKAGHVAMVTTAVTFSNTRLLLSNLFLRRKKFCYWLFIISYSSCKSL